MYCDLKLSSHFTVIKAYNPSYISDVQSVGLKREVRRWKSRGSPKQYLGEILDQTGLAGDYYTDLTIGYVLSFVCGARYIIHAFRASNGSYTMKKH